MGICLVLGGGGARGIAHVGVLKVLADAGITINRIIGTSAGAMMGGLYAYNPDVDWLENIILSSKRKHVVRRNWSTFKGYSNGKDFLKFMRKHINHADFADLQIPFTAIAADMDDGSLVPINTGDVAMAQLCSSALPPIYAPINHMGRRLYDGGCIEIVASDYARTIIPEGEPIVAVQVGIALPDKRAKGIRSIITRFNQTRLVYFDKYCASSADVVIKPDIPGASILDDSDKPGLIQKGIDATLAQLPTIKALIASST
jgi:NTE family protein